MGSWWSQEARQEPHPHDFPNTPVVSSQLTWIDGTGQIHAGTDPVSPKDLQVLKDIQTALSADK
jgi:hypothetical protein